MNRLEVLNQVLLCESCDLPSRCSGPVPFSGPAPTDVAILGEAPGAQEDKAGKPFVGRAGQLMRTALALAGFDPDSLFWCNTVSCYPTREDGRGRTPFEAEINACSNNRAAQLQISGASWVVMTGNVPLRAYRPDLRIGKAHGRPLAFPTFVGFPVYHPAAALRNPVWASDLRADLATLKKMVDAGPGWPGLVPQTCIWCDAPAVQGIVDGQGVPYCPAHVKRAPEE